MASSQRDQKELVRLLVLQHGQKTASDISKVPYETVRKWTQRGKWLAVPNVPNLPTTKAIVDNYASEIEKNGKATKLSLSRTAKKLAEQAERAKLKHSRNVKEVAQTAAIVHPEMFGDKKQDQTNLAVNIALLRV